MTTTIRRAPISIVICTHERPAQLDRCLRAVAPSVMDGHEVIVVDNAPAGEETWRVAARYPVRYLRELRRGLDHARNRGLHAAHHSIVAYTDDDAQPAAGWANAIADAFTSPDIGCVTGLVLPVALETAAQRQFEAYCAHRRVLHAQQFTAPGTPPAAAGVVGMGANMAFRREVLFALDGFDPRLDGGTATRSGGDTDMFARVLDAGWRIVYTPAARVGHEHHRELRAVRACVFGYGVGLYSVLTKRLLEARDPQALVIAARWFVGPFIRWARLRIANRPATPTSLVVLEACGAFLGPVSYWRETRRHRHV
jgi:glycosyltransferase involved in cell wall biosynthesis